MTVSRITGVAAIVKAYVGRNEVGQGDLPGLIRTVHASLAEPPPRRAPVGAGRGAPAVPVDQSVTPDYIVSLENGRRYKTLKRHLEALGLTPMQYRAKWDLPLDYPLIAPNYTRQRSEFTKAVWSGRGASGRARRADRPGHPAGSAPAAAPRAADRAKPDQPAKRS